jgi:hypothetical protein
MKIRQTTGKIEKGKLSAIVPKDLSDGEVDLVELSWQKMNPINLKKCERSRQKKAMITKRKLGI